jgi:hypothetical protein
MMNVSRLTQSLLLLSLLWTATLLPLGAQSALKATSLKFSCVVWEPLSISPIYYRDGKSYLPLEFYPGIRSKLYPLKEGDGLELYKDAVGPDGKPTYELVGKAPLVAGARQILFLVDPVPNASGLPLRLYGMNDALDIFPPGTFRFFNFSPTTLRVKFGGQVNQLPAGESTVVKSNVPKLGGFTPFLVGDATGKIIFGTRLFSQPTGREIVFISPPAKPDGLARVKFITEIVPPEPAKPAGQKQVVSP